MKNEENKKQPSIGLKIAKKARFAGTVVFMAGFVYAALLKRSLSYEKKAQ